ncbi:uncharacterized protein EAF01_002537 [Botrytis porri]|uniref:Uncharacterized protein n=1 Tax=Botrytis porri TaxID=87229 RepID=A0A4Z1L258_9HELO|nr:uncharacterized protein EAF01_002537 [Botrytis porri]KAF7911029.1 hypothetical protein EAF01_002537 [Botrytis porri]TGO90796.1 hypothetical protein BPOR_0050g00010 [Botrytis porri]
MSSQIPANAGASMPASEIQALAMSGQENFIPAAEEASQDSHSFLYLAPKTSAGYPVAQSAKMSAALTPRQLGNQTRVTVGGEKLGEKGVGDEDGRAKNSGSIEQELGKPSRSESMSSQASNSTVASVDGSKGMSSRRFLKLGPVHFGEAGLGDWSEEVVE